VRRPLALLYGLFAYLLAVGSMVYLVAWVNGVLVSRGIDDGLAAPLALALAIDSGLLLLFGLSHSLMARDGFKRALARIQPPELERSTYTLVSGATLGLTFWQWRPLSAVFWDLSGTVAGYFLLGMSLAGFALAVAGFLAVGNTRLYGLQQAWRYARGEPQAEEALVVSGVYRWLRHPLYAGFVLGCWAGPVMSHGRALFAAGTTLYILIGMRFEARDLERRFGPRFHGYRAAVPGWLPRPGRRFRGGAASDR
jgi:protein-S-isoprenylcysteine O-methyltransferase Ste14